MLTSQEDERCLAKVFFHHPANSKLLSQTSKTGAAIENFKEWAEGRPHSGPAR